ncbi:MAG: hypothetical protein JRG86_23830 [Deltaproteobacteria bacterium]|nr:hypothetical protein [Deltaproteobacteria bacterium]MBW2500780.1 hypothetical protein [Deltaproteobacteria bacterium]
MKPPLREFVVGKDLAREEVEERDCAFLQQLGGPALIRLAGRDSSRVRIVSTLLHANEPSGLRAVIRFLRSGDIPATDVVFFVGAVGTALVEPGFAHRALPGERDANRCWTAPWDSPQGEVARQVLEALLALGPECLVDIHNNTGHNPAYGVAFKVGHAEQSLVSLFADRIVHTPIELGTIVEATVPHFPSVTVECGRAGDPVADEVAWEGLRRYLDWDRIDFERPVVPLLLLESPMRICVRPGVELAFGDEVHPEVPLTISRDIDRHNFERLAAGSGIGWVRSDASWPIEAVGADGSDRSHEFFEIEEGVLRTRREFIPIMMTTDRVIAKSDCLFYAVQPAAHGTIASPRERSS